MTDLDNIICLTGLSHPVQDTYNQAGIFPANPRTLFVGNSQSHRKS